MSAEAKQEDALKVDVTNLPKRPMSIERQSYFIAELMARCRMHSKEDAEIYAGEAKVTLTLNDIAALETIRRTLELCDIYGADEMIRRRISNMKRGKR